MGLINRFKGLLSRRGKTLAWYRAGMARANARDYAGAIQDYTAAIEAPDCPADVRGMAIYNRALAYAAVHEDSKAADDLAAVLDIPGVPQNIKKEAHQRRARLRRRAERNDGES